MKRLFERRHNNNRPLVQSGGRRMLDPDETLTCVTARVVVCLLVLVVLLLVRRRLFVLWALTSSSSWAASSPLDICPGKSALKCANPGHSSKWCANDAIVPNQKQLRHLAISTSSLVRKCDDAMWWATASPPPLIIARQEHNTSSGWIYAYKVGWWEIKCSLIPSMLCWTEYRHRGRGHRTGLGWKLDGRQSPSIRR